MAKVYVANLGGHDLSDAKQYGELVYLTLHGYKPSDLDRVTFEVAARLQHFDPRRDYYLPVGQDLINLTAMWFLASRHDTIPTLYWDIKEKRYVTQTYQPKLMNQVMENLKIRKEIEKNVEFAGYSG